MVTQSTQLIENLKYKIEDLNVFIKYNNYKYIYVLRIDHECDRNFFGKHVNLIRDIYLVYYSAFRVWIHILFVLS